MALSSGSCLVRLLMLVLLYSAFAPVHYTCLTVATTAFDMPPSAQPAAPLAGCLYDSLAAKPPPCRQRLWRMNRLGGRPRQNAARSSSALPRTYGDVRTAAYLRVAASLLAPAPYRAPCAARRAAPRTAAWRWAALRQRLRRNAHLFSIPPALLRPLRGIALPLRMGGVSWRLV